MINKLKMKFVLAAMIAITIVTVVIFGMIQIDNHVRMNNQIDEIIEIIIDNGGTFPKRDSADRSNPYINQETRFTTRYFVATLDDSGNIESIETDNISYISEDDATEIANKILSKSKQKGNYENFRYKVSSDNKMIVVVDCSVQIRNQKQFTQKADIIIIAGLFVTFVIIYFLSNKAVEPTVKAIQKQKEFISNAGHDLKTPVSIILADAEVLQMQENEQNKEFVESIKNQSHRLNELINNLLGLAKLDEMSNKIVSSKEGPILAFKKAEKSEENNLNVTKFSLNELAKDKVKEMNVLLKDKNVECYLDNEVFAMADKEEITQVVMILLDNSNKYVDENGTIKISVEKQGKFAKFAISNTYKDVKNVDTKRIFDRFYREDKSRNSKKDGHGIGLSMAKTIIDMNKGKIYAENIDNKEICFTVLLPSA